MTTHVSHARVTIQVHGSESSSYLTRNDDGNSLTFQPPKPKGGQQQQQPDPRKIRVDSCAAGTETSHELYRRVHGGRLVEEAVEGYKTGLYIVGSGLRTGNVGMELLELVVGRLKQLIQLDSTNRLQMLFLGVSDMKCIDLIQDRPVNLSESLERFYMDVKNWDELATLQSRGSSLPWVIDFKIYPRAGSAVGSFLIADLGMASFDAKDSEEDGAQQRQRGPDLSKSMLAFSNCISVLSEKGVEGNLPISESHLTQVIHKTVGFSSQASLLMLLDGSTETADPKEISAALKFAENLRNLKCFRKRNCSEARIFELHRQVQFQKELNERTADEFSQHLESVKKEHAVILQEWQKNIVASQEKMAEQMKKERQNVATHVEKVEKEVAEYMRKQQEEHKTMIRSIEAKHAASLEEIIRENEKETVSSRFHLSKAIHEKISTEEELRLCNVELLKLSYEYEQRRIAGETLQIQVKESENLTNRLRIRLDKAAHKASCEKAALENELDSLKEEYEQTRQECDRYQKGVESIQGELADRRNKYSQLESAFASLRCQADDDKEKANQDRNVLIKQVETTKTDLESLSAVHDAFKATLTELQGKMEDSKNQVAALEKQLADFKASAAREAEKLKAELQSSDLELKQLSFECQQAKIAKEELQSQMQNSKNLISSLEKHLADVTERALLEKTQLEEELRSARLDLKQVSSDHKQCQNTVLELEANVQKALSEKSRHEDDLRSTKNELQQVSSECRQCQTAKLELQAHVQTANKLVADLEKQLYDLRHQSRNDSDLHAHVQNSNNMVMNLERQLADIREQLRREKQDSEATRSAPLLDAPIVEVAVSKQPRKRAPPKASRKKQEIPAPRPRSPSPQTSGDFMDEASDYEPDGADDPAPESPVEPVDAPILEATVRRSPRKRAPPKTSKKKQQVPARRPRSPSVEPLEDPAEPSDHEPEDAPIAEATVIKPPRKRAPPKTSKMKQEIPPPSPNSPSAEPLEDANAGTSGYELDSVTVGPLDIPIGKAAVSKPPRKRAPPKASKKKQEILPPRSRSPSADPVEHGPDSVDHSVPKPPVGQPSHYMQGSSIDDILAATATAEEAKRANTKAEGKKPAKRAASGGRKKKDAPLAPAVEPVNMDTASANSPDEAPSEPAPSRKRKLGSKRTLASDVIPDAEADDEVDPPKPAKKRATAKTATRKRATNKKTSSEAEAPSPISAPQPPSPTPASGVLTSASDAPNIPNQVDPSPQQKPAPSDSDRPRLSLENRAALAENVRPTIKNRLLNLNAEGRMQFKPRPNMDPERMKKLFLGFGLGS